MDDRSPIRVTVPRRPEPAFHVARYPVPAPTVRFTEVLLPIPGFERRLASELMLPLDERRGVQFPGTSGHSSGLALPWVDHDRMPLLVPHLVRDEDRFRRHLGAGIFVSPSSLTTFPFASDDLADLGWLVLSRLNFEELAVVLAQLAVVAEYQTRDSSAGEHLATVIGAAEPWGVEMSGRARAGDPILAPKAVRWVLLELASAPEHEVMWRRRWRPGSWYWSVGQHLDLPARVLFPATFGGGQVTVAEVVRAVWLIQERYRGTTIRDIDGADALLMLNQLAFAHPIIGDFKDRLAVWHAVWDVDDDHHCLQKGQLVPSQMHSAYSAALGVDPRVFLAGALALGYHAFARFLEPTTPLLSEAQLDSFHPGLGAAVSAHLSLTSDGLRREALADRQKLSDYEGLGTLPQTDSVVIRNRPLLRLSNGALLPLGVQVLGQTATSLHRWLLAKAMGVSFTRAAAGVARLFEAALANLIDQTIGKRYTIVHSGRLEALLGRSGSCDALVVCADGWLLIEASTQLVARPAAGGDPATITNMCERYHREADQCDAVMPHVGHLCAELHLPSPERVVALVVTDAPIPLHAGTHQELERMRPERNPKFVCGLEEFVLLVELGEAGFSPASLVAAWQTSGAPVQLGQHLREASQVRRAEKAWTDRETDRMLERLQPR